MACSQVKKPLITLSHLASADDLKNPKTMQQLARFQKITESFEGAKSIARSAAIMSNPQTHLDWVRPGIMLYGATPFAHEVGNDRGLQPVMTMKSQLISIKHIPKGETVGYGETWKCEEEMPVGIVGFGYADGYPRHMAQGTPVLINGVRCPLIGRVSMDMITVDLRPCPNAKIGDAAILWGPELPIEIIAHSANTVPYSLWVNITQRVKFVEK
jgi:alanine racemase